jgi:hypothetical protein
VPADQASQAKGQRHNSFRPTQGPYIQVNGVPADQASQAKGQRQDSLRPAQGPYIQVNGVPADQANQAKGHRLGPLFEQLWCRPGSGSRLFLQNPDQKFAVYQKFLNLFDRNVLYTLFRRPL